MAIHQKTWIITYNTPDPKIWCNLSTLCKLSWTEYFPETEWSILYLEVYSPDPVMRIIQLKNLQLQWVFEKISWLVIWYNLWYEDVKRKEKYPTLDKEWKRYWFEDIINSVLAEYSFPILKINEFWHYCPNCFLPIWAQCKVDADAQTVEII